MIIFNQNSQILIKMSLIRLDDGGIVNLASITRIYPVQPYNETKYKLCFSNDSIYITERDYIRIKNTIDPITDSIVPTENNPVYAVYQRADKSADSEILGVYNKREDALTDIMGYISDNHYPTNCGEEYKSSYDYLDKNSQIDDYEIIEMKLNKRWY